MKKIKFGLLTKFALAASLLIILSSIVLAFFLFQIEGLRITRDLKNHGLVLTRNLAYNSEYGILAKNPEALMRLAKGLIEEEGIVYVEILDVKGNIMAKDTRKRVEPGIQVFNIEVPVTSSSLKRTPEEIAIVPASPAKEENQEEIIGKVKIGISNAQVYRELRQLLVVILSLTLTVIAIGILGIYLLTSNLLINPLRQFVGGTQKIAQGDLTSKIKIESQDEIGELASSFNGMAEELEKSKDKIGAYTKNLEETVKERTIELGKKVENLTGTRRAITHLLKDLNENQDKLKEDYEKLQELDRMKGDFVSTVSHELRSPLAAIQEGANLIFEELLGKINNEQKDLLNMIIRNADRLSRLINNILDFQKMRSGKIGCDIRVNNINQVAQEVCKTMELLAKEKRLGCSVDMDERLPAIKFDEDKVAQVLTNLLSNAIKMTEKGNVTIITKLEDNAAHVMVRDTGCGIKHEDLHKLFLPFEQLGDSKSKKKGGTGLGLAISQEIILAHKGKIWAESEVGKGSTFHFTLPINE